MPKLIAILLICLLPCLAMGQIVVSGKVVQAANQEPVAYANIGILNTNVGTISNADGSFSITIPKGLEDRNLSFSALGFQLLSVSIPSAPSPQNMRVVLQEKVTALQTVVIRDRARKEKSVKLGNGRSILLAGQLYLDSASAGSAMALLIDKSDYPDFVFPGQASLHIALNKSPEFKVRLRVLSVDHDNDQKPGEDLLEVNLTKTSDMRKGWLHFDLSELELQLHEPQFYLMFEWIMDKADRKSVAEAYSNYMEEFPDRVTYDTVLVDGVEEIDPKIGVLLAGTVFGITQSQKDLTNYRSYYRTNSFGEWKRSSSTLSAKIELHNSPYGEREDKVVPPANDLPLEASINRWAEDWMKEKSIPGMQLAISRKGETVFSNGFGLADQAQHIPVSTSTQFRIASVSKTMTATTLTKLMVARGIDPDTPVQQFAPSFPEKEHPVTIRQVAGHLGGIRDYHEISLEEVLVQEHYRNSSEALAIFKDAPLAATPGTKFVYSSYGYVLLGAVLEGICKQSFLNCMSETLWNPLGMEHTDGDVSGRVFPQKSKFYDYTGAEAKPYDLSYSYASGGMISTSEDLLLFGQALLGDFASPEVKALLFSAQQTADARSTNYGWGWYLTKDQQGRSLWYHAGELPSSGSFLFICPDEEVVISLLTNGPIITETEDEMLHEAQRLMELMLKQ